MKDKPSDIPTPVDFFNWLNQFVNMQTPETAKAADAFDPLNVWKTFNEQNQKAWSEAMTKMKATPEFASVLGQATLNQATAQEMVRKASQAYLEAANMPSLDDLARVAKLVIAVEAKLDHLDEKLTGYLGRAGKNTAVETRLDKLAERLTGLEVSLEKVVGLEAVPGMVDKVQGRLEAFGTRLDNLERQQAQILKSLNSTPTPTQPASPARPEKAPAKKPTGEGKGKTQQANSPGNESKS